MTELAKHRIKRIWLFKLNSVNWKTKKILKCHLEVPQLVKSCTLDALAIEMHALILNYSKCINISPCMFGGCATPFEHECWWIPPWGCGVPARPSLSSWRSYCSFWGESQRGGARPTTVAPSPDQGEKCRWSNQCERGAFCLSPSLPLLSLPPTPSTLIGEAECHKVSAHLKTVVASLTYNSPL